MQSFLMLCLLWVAGCSAIGPYVAQAEKIADAEVTTFEYGFCHGARVMAWFRKYGTDQKKIEAWTTICLPPTQKVPAVEVKS